MKYTPVGTRVLLELVEKPQDKESLIIMIDTSVSEAYGKVISMGEGFVTDAGLLPMSIEVDQVVLFSKNKGQMVSLDGNKYVLLNYQDILVKLGQ